TCRMRSANRIGRTVVLRLRYDDFSRATRSHTLPQPTAHTGTILAIARELLAAAIPKIAHEGLTLVGVAVANLDNDDVVQLALPFDHQSGSALDTALDDVRDKFGSASVTRAVLLGKRAGEPMPMLPD
ncbi:MAG: polymerase, partial [Actinomycetota bacterium]|nr:polymerase [Actinomycetota bacterium]